MKRLNDAELNQKIENFMSRKREQHPELQQSDGARAGKMWQMDTRLKEVWRAFHDQPHTPVTQQ